MLCGIDSLPFCRERQCKLGLSAAFASPEKDACPYSKKSDCHSATGGPKHVVPVESEPFQDGRRQEKDLPTCGVGRFGPQEKRFDRRGIRVRVSWLDNPRLFYHYSVARTVALPSRLSLRRQQKA